MVAFSFATSIIILLVIAHAFAARPPIESSVIPKKIKDMTRIKADNIPKLQRPKNPASFIANAIEAIKLNAFELCICGALATAFGDLCLHPIDTIKVMQQSSPQVIGMIAAAKTIFASNGMLGFYQGVVPYVVADGFSGAIKFATFELSKSYIEDRVDSKYHPLVQFFCAAGAMFACSFVLVPGEVLKTRLQAGTVKNLMGGISSIVKAEGIKGLFSGYFSTLVRDVPYTMLELGLYENIKMMMRKFQQKDELNPRDELFAAAVTGAVTGFITTPLDVVKTKLMLESNSDSVVSTFMSIYKSGGVDALFVGSTARVLWLLPFTTIYLGAYEFLKKSIITMKQQSTKEE